MVKNIMEIDEIDKKIIEFLQEDGRMPFLEIAKKLKLSESTIRKRVENLKEKIYNKINMMLEEINDINDPNKINNILSIIERLIRILKELQ